MRGGGAIAHYIGKEEKRVVFFGHIFYLAPYHGYPFIKNLFKVIGRNLYADDVAFGNGGFYGVNKFLLVGFYFKTYKVGAYVRADSIKGFGRVTAGALAPLNGFLFEERNYIGTFHNSRFLSVYHRQELRHGLAFVECLLHIVHQLGKHGIAAKVGVVLGLEPYFFGLNINQVFAVAL